MCAEFPPRYAPSFVRPLARALAKRGVDTAAVAGGVLEPQGDAFVPAIPVLDALEEVARQLDAPHLGVELARDLPLGAFGTIEHRFSASPTLGDALARFGPHHEQVVETRQFTLELADVVRIEMRPRFRFPRLYPVGETFGLAFAVRRLRDVLGELVFDLRSVGMVFPAPSNREPYDAYFGVPVEFGAERYEFTFPPELIAAPLATANPELSRMLGDEPPVAGARPRASTDPFLERVRGAIRDGLAEETPTVGIGAVATRLGMTPRSFQRRLQEQQTSYSDLVDDVRRELAKTMLAEEGTLLCSIAYQLGYSGVTPFFRAFRRWTGASPREFQRGR
jgi:AraC-like DNA-binding protein